MSIGDYFLQKLQQLKRALSTLDNLGTNIESVGDTANRAIALCWEIIHEMSELHQSPGNAELYQNIEKEALPLLLRSEIFWRARFKPKGYSGDFNLMERVYDESISLGRNPNISAVENVLNAALFKSHGVNSLVQRVYYFESLIESKVSEGNKISILDVGGGGAMYFRRLMDRIKGGAYQIQYDIFDQDKTLVNFWNTIPKVNDINVRIINKSAIKILRGGIEGKYDLIISAGLFDYFDLRLSSLMIERLMRSLRPDGTFVFANFLSTESQFEHYFRESLLDWHLETKTMEQMLDLLPTKVVDSEVIGDYDVGTVTLAN